MKKKTVGTRLKEAANRMVVYRELREQVEAYNELREAEKVAVPIRYALAEAEDHTCRCQAAYRKTVSKVLERAKQVLNNQ